MDWKEIMRTLYGIEQPLGCTDEEIRAVKDIFGALPAVVEDFWRTFGRTEGLNYVQDTWCLPEHYAKWTWLTDYDYLILLNENQGCCQAGIRREDLALPDPPVFISSDNGSWVLSANTTSEFLEAALTYEAVWQMEFVSEEFYWLPEEAMEQVRAELTKKDVELKGWFSMDISFYHNRPDNLAVIMDVGGQYQCLCGAAAEESYLDLMDIMEGLGEPI